MGLLLSILVSCAGVIELIAFYSNLRRGLVLPNADNSDIETVVGNYKRMLNSEYRHILEEINGKVVTANGRIEHNYSLSTSPKVVFKSETSEGPTTNNIKTVTSKIGGTEVTPNENHIQNSGSEDLAEERSRSHTPVPTATTEKDNSSTDIRLSRSRSPSPTLETIYAGEEIISDPVHGRRSCSPFPTYELLAPRGSICSELLENPTISVTEVDEDVEEDKVQNPEKIDVILEAGSYNTTDYWTNKVLVEPSKRSRSRSRSPSRIGKSPPREVEEHRSSKFHGHASGHRSRSRSPSRHKHSSSLAPEERIHKHRSLSPKINADLTPALQRRRRSRSFSGEEDSLAEISQTFSQVVEKNYWRRSPSPFEKLLQTTDQVVEIFDDDFKNTLDGVKSHSNEERKREFRKKRNLKWVGNVKKQSDESSESIESASFSSSFLSTKNVMCEKTVVYETSGEEKSPSTSKQSLETKDTPPSVKESKPINSDEEKKKPEPFWVN